GSEHDLAHVGIVTDAREHEIGVLDRFRHGSRLATAVLGGPAFGFLGRAVVDGHAMPGFAEPAGHRIPHHAEPEKCHVQSHRSLPSRYASSVAAVCRANASYGARSAAVDAECSAQKEPNSRTRRTTRSNSISVNGAGARP